MFISIKKCSIEISRKTFSWFSYFQYLRTSCIWGTSCFKCYAFNSLGIGYGCLCITWGAMASGLCPYPTGAVIPWTTPPFISGYLATGSIMGVVVQLVNFIVGTLIYIPFVKMYDKQLLKDEQLQVEE